MDARRDYSIDALKGIGIIFVVAGHYSLYSDYRSWYDWIWSFHMPLFFCVGGYLFALKSEFYLVSGFKKYFANQAKKLLLPYMVFFIIYFVVYYLHIPFLQPIEISKNDWYNLLSAFFLGGGGSWQKHR